MDLNDLALFTRVVERGSFTAAAKAIGLPKSSVTRSIARLERELNVRLIQRTTRQRGITDAGRELYERVRGAVGALEEATETVREHGAEPAGVVRVTANPDAGLTSLPEAVVALRAKWPKIHVELILTTRVVDLVAEGVDIGVRAGKLADSSLVAKRVGLENSALFASKAYLKKRGRPVKLADLATHDCVLFRGHRGRGTWTLESTRGPQQVDLEGVASVDDFIVLGKMLAEGIGIGPMPQFIAHRQGGLERVLPDYFIAGAPLSIVMPSGSFVPTRVTAVRDFLVDHFTTMMKVCDQKLAAG